MTSLSLVTSSLGGTPDNPGLPCLGDPDSGRRKEVLRRAHVESVFTIPRLDVDETDCALTGERRGLYGPSGFVFSYHLE